MNSGAGCQIESSLLVQFAGRVAVTAQHSRLSGVWKTPLVLPDQSSVSTDTPQVNFSTAHDQSLADYYHHVTVIVLGHGLSGLPTMIITAVYTHIENASRVGVSWWCFTVLSQCR